MVSRKWRTNNTRPKAVQPCDPCSSGRQRSIPRNASEAPMVELILSGFRSNGFAKMAHEQHQAEGGTTLRPVQQRQAALHPQKCERSTYGRTHLERIPI